MNPALLTEFEQLLQGTIGLDASSVGSSAVAHAVRARMAACGLVDARVYREMLAEHASELQALAEAVVVAETWFFRDRAAFAAMVEIAHKEWLPNHSQETLRLLSLPCASGEEAYSMSMALLDSGFPANRYAIDAIDISTQVLAQARRGEYGKNSFRGADLSFRDRHCEATARGYRVSDAVRHPVRFQQGNLLAAGFLPGAEMYDVIFCRNLLIYFERQARDHAIGVLRRLLTAKGVLFVGPSEASLLLSHGFMSTKVPLAFAFRKVEPIEHASAAVSALCPAQGVKRQRSVPTVAAYDRSAARPHQSVEASLQTPDSQVAGIEQAALLADQGRLGEAAKCCEAHLRMYGPSPEAFHLMGLLRAAAGSLTEAAEYYRKTLYLDPDHSQSLIHLALLLEKQGDKAAAKVMSDRARRLHERGKQHAG